MKSKNKKLRKLTKTRKAWGTLLKYSNKDDEFELLCRHNVAHIDELEEINRLKEKGS